MKEKLPLDKIRNNAGLRDEFIARYSNFILSSASKVSGKFISRNADEFSIALIAFDEAISKYEESKGDFFAFAYIIIKNRLIDYYRKEKNNTIPFSELSCNNDEDESSEYQVVGSLDIANDLAFEFGTLKEELSKYEISILELPKYSPKSTKTKAMVYDVLTFIKSNDTAKKSVLVKKIMPSKLICENLSVKQKLLERHKKYIIAAIIILCGDYPHIAEYINNLKGEKK